MMTAEKRADSVIRWLERMKKSYSSGRIETAFMDAECAMADFEDLRDDVFARLTNTPKTGRGVLALFLRSVFLAFVIVMAAVMPLSREESVVVPVEPAQTVAVQETTVQADSKPKITQKSKKIQKRPQTVSKIVSPKKTNVQPTNTNKSVAYDKLTYLLKIGQKTFNKEP
ncbi:MAG: hypothetical protein IJR98_03730 [Synergistaceae bacterium]|nr:hypothetical protein [Synergistaceae bacterium]